MGTLRRFAGASREALPPQKLWGLRGLGLRVRV